MRGLQHRLQHDAAVGEEHALRVAGGGRRVAHRGRRTLAELTELEVVVTGGDELLVGHHRLKRGLRQLIGIAEHDVLLHGVDAVSGHHLDVGDLIYI